MFSVNRNFINEINSVAVTPLPCGVMDLFLTPQILELLNDITEITEFPLIFLRLFISPCLHM